MAVALALLPSACDRFGSALGGHPGAGAAGPPEDAIVVGSFDFPESALLGELYSQALEVAGYPVQRALGIGPREIVGPALAQGHLHLVPEYAGTALLYHGIGQTEAPSDPGRTHAALARAVAGRGLIALAPAPAQNHNVFVVTTDTARRHGLQTLSNLAALSPPLTFGGPPECPARTLCLAGLESRYGLRVAGFVALDAGGPLTRQALRQGLVDVGLLFSTDPSLTSAELTPLVDDLALQPAENITPLMRAEVLERHGTEVVRVLDAVSARLTTASLGHLNARVQSGHDPVEVSADWLADQLLAGSGRGR